MEAASLGPSAFGRWTAAAGPASLHGFGRGVLECGRDAARLTDADLAACARQVAQARTASLPKVDAIPQAKRSYYDAVAKAYAMRHAPTPVPFTVGGPGTNLVAGERWAGALGAHLPGFGCALPFGLPKGWKKPKHGPPHSLKLGALPCYITPPSGFLTEEADIPSPVDLPHSS